MAHAMGKPGWGDLGLWWACAQVKLGGEPGAHDFAVSYIRALRTHERQTLPPAHI